MVEHADAQHQIRSNLRRRRLTLGLTQDQVATVLKMSRLTYHRIEAGTRWVRFEEIATICEAFNCSVSSLVDDPEVARTHEQLAPSIVSEIP